MTSRLTFAALVAPFLVVLSGGTAAAQIVSATSQPYPNRIVNGANLGFSTRPATFTPLGVNEQDCLQDMTLQFSVTLVGFTGTDTLEVWGSLDSDCTAATDRGIGASSAVCWGLRAGNLVDPIVNTPQTVVLNVRVQDLVGWQQGAPPAAEAAMPPAKGKEACAAQATPVAVPMSINFLAVNADGNVDGTPYQYRITTDLLPPTTPTGVSVSTVGADLLARWTPNTDKDTVGYDVFFASAPAPDGQAACSGLTLARQGDGDPTVTSASGTSYDLGPAESDTQGAVIVSAVDAFDNVSQGETPICDSVGTVEAEAPGVACAVAAPGEAGSASACLGLLGAAWMMTRRSRRRR
jgi:hypothetical protein